MGPTHWHKQTADRPLFPDLLWSRPESKQRAGKLLIIGGNLYGFSAPAEAYQAATTAGIGTARVILPECLRKTVGPLLAADYAACTPSGSFSREALGEWLEHAAWADAVLLAGDLGRNSETAILIESFLQKFAGQAILAKDAVDYATTNPKMVLQRTNTTLVLSLAQLQKFAKATASLVAVTFDMDMVRLVDFLHGFTTEHPLNVIVKHLDNIFVAAGGQVSTTKLSEDLPVWRVRTAAAAAVWLLQHAERPFESLTTGQIAFDNKS